MINLNAPIGARMWEALKAVLQQERTASWQAAFDTTRQTMRATGNAVQVYTISPDTVAALAENNVVLENAAVWMRDTELLHALRDTKALRGASLPDSIWRNLPAELEAATPYLDTVTNTLIYIVDLGGDIGKIVVRVNYNEKGRFDGVRAKVISNFIQTGGSIEDYNLKQAQYVDLAGK